jgi:hypothetical protein
MSPNKERINEYAAHHSFIRFPFVDKSLTGVQVLHFFFASLAPWREILILGEVINEIFAPLRAFVVNS